MLEIDNVSAFHGEAVAIRDVSLRVADGEIVTLCGRNGAGKTTLLRTIMGLHRQHTGQIRYGGVDITRAPSHVRARLGLGWVPDDRGAYATLTVEESLTLSHVRKADSWSLDRIYETFP